MTRELRYKRLWVVLRWYHASERPVFFTYLNIPQNVAMCESGVDSYEVGQGISCCFRQGGQDGVRGSPVLIACRGRFTRDTTASAQQMCRFIESQQRKKQQKIRLLGNE